MRFKALLYLACCILAIMMSACSSEQATLESWGSNTDLSSTSTTESSSDADSNIDNKAYMDLVDNYIMSIVDNDKARYEKTISDAQKKYIEANVCNSQQQYYTDLDAYFESSVNEMHKVLQDRYGDKMVAKYKLLSEDTMSEEEAISCKEALEMYAASAGSNISVDNFYKLIIELTINDDTQSFDLMICTINGDWMVYLSDMLINLN